MCVARTVTRGSVGQVSPAPSPKPSPTPPSRPPATSSSSEKTERLLNLILCLKSARTPVTKAKIRQSIDDYRAAQSDEAFERMFERDKDDLRTLGIPIRTTVIDAFFDNEIGYRVVGDDTALPDISFEPDEVLALGMAARAWSSASLAGPAAGALRKLRVAGMELDESELDDVQPLIRTPEAAFEPLRRALDARRAVRFDYRRGDATDTETRQVQPWALKFTRGRWYLTGFDTDRQDQRAFRLGRIVGTVTLVGRAGAYEVPADHVPTVQAGFADEDTAVDAAVRVRADSGHALRRRASQVVDAGDGWVTLTVPYTPATLREVLLLGERAVAQSPPELVADVVHALVGVAGAERATRGEVDRDAGA